MEKALLFAILALSMNAFAQNTRPAFNIQHPALKSFENFQGRTVDGGGKTPGIFSEMNSGTAIKHHAPQQPSLIQLYDSIYGWQWDTLDIGWKNDSRLIDIIYDANNNLTSFIEQSRNSSAWENVSKYISAYDASNNEISYLHQTWNGSDWENSFQGIYTYDAGNNLTNELYQSWNGSAWVNEEQYIYTYDANNNQTSWLMANLERQRLGEFLRQYVYSFDASNNMTNELYQTWNGSAWENYYQ